jgi:hypothetical protein
MEMKPFDLERARAGDPITTKDGAPVHFVGVTETNEPVIQRAGYVEVWLPSYLRMAPKKTTFYVNVYKAPYRLWCGTPETTIEEAERARKDAHGTESANFYKVVSFEVEE